MAAIRVPDYFRKVVAEVRAGLPGALKFAMVPRIVIQLTLRDFRSC
jgi:hypothetical protein